MDEPKQELTPSAETKEQFQNRLQKLLDNQRFQRAVSSHRLADMSRHSIDLFKNFPDYSPPPLVLKQLQVATAGNYYSFSDDQMQSFISEWTNAGNHLRSAWVFTAGQDIQETMHVLAGHSIILDPIIQTPC